MTKVTAAKAAAGDGIVDVVVETILTYVMSSTLHAHPLPTPPLQNPPVLPPPPSYLS